MSQPNIDHSGSFSAVGFLMLAGAVVLGIEAMKHLGRVTQPATASAAPSSSGQQSAAPSATGTSQPSQSSTSQPPATTSQPTNQSAPVSSSGSNSDYVTQALSQAGAPLSWLPQILWIIGKESGGDNSAVNPVAVCSDGSVSRNDICPPGTTNYGHATGLMQLLPATFQHYFPNGNINDPVQNIVAGILHIKDAWGTPYNQRLIDSENAGIGY